MSAGSPASGRGRVSTWTVEQDAELRRKAAAGVGFAAIAEALGFDRGTVRNRAMKLGILAPQRGGSDPERIAVSARARINGSADGWTAEKLKILTCELEAGKTAAQIAAALGDGITRNAVCGKLARLKLTLKRAHSPPPPAAEKPCAPPSRPTRREPPPKPISRRSEALRRVLEESDAGAAAPVGVSLLDLRENHCRWPLWGDTGDEERLYCGAAVAARAYCGAHCRLAGQARA
jgi:GcrA cell cycle regulator